MTAVDFVEIALRGGAIALILVLTAQIIVRRPLPAAGWFGVGFLLTAALYAFTKTEFIHQNLGPLHVPNQIVTMASPVFFWLFVLALIDDRFRWKSWMVLPFAFVAASVLLCVPFPGLSPYTKIVQLMFVLVLMWDVVRKVRCSMPDDLVDSRRHFSGTLNYLVPLIAAVIIGIEILESLEISTMASRLAISASLLAVAIVLTMAMSTLRKSLLPKPDSKPASAITAQNLTAADRIDLGRLRDLMEEGVYMNAGLTIGSLASSMNVPEHRLRKLINNGMGYRNFAAFVNDHRIAEAQKRLAEPQLVHAQITNLAFDIGYASLAPFNRAFRERTGMSPSEWREKALTVNANGQAA